MVIAEVKTNQPCTLNGPWTEADQQNVHRVLAAIGCLPKGSITDAANDLYRAGIHIGDSGLRIRLMAVGRDRNGELATKSPDVPQLVWTDLLGFIWRRFKTYQHQKRDVGQWDAQGRLIKELADRSNDPDAFVNEATRLMGVRRVSA